MQLPFFFKKKKILSKNLFPEIKHKNVEINFVKTLNNANKFDLSFFDSIKYKSYASSTKASFCLTTEKLKNFLPVTTEKIIVKNVLYELAVLLKKLYPLADIDYPDMSVKKPLLSKFKNVKFGNNVLVGKNVKIGKNTLIGANTIIEHDVIIGNKSVIAKIR